MSFTDSKSMQGLVDLMNEAANSNQWKESNAYAEALFDKWRQNLLTPGTDEEMLRFFEKWTQILKHIPAVENSSADSTVRIVLNVIQNNESAVIRRCIESALPILDAVVLSNNFKPNVTVTKNPSL